MPSSQANINLAIKAMCDAIIQACAVPDGVPGGTIYAALMSQGCTLAQFEAIMSTLVTLGKVSKRGNCYYGLPNHFDEVA